MKINTITKSGTSTSWQVFRDKLYQQMPELYEIPPMPGDEIRLLRKFAGLTQLEIAKKVGTKQPAIARLESDESVPSVRFLHRVALALGYELRIDFKKIPNKLNQETGEGKND